MRELNLQIEDSKYNQFVQFLTTIDYVKILTQLQQTNAADTEKKVSAKVAKQKKTATPLNAAEERIAKIKALRGSISKEAGEEMLQQLAEMRNEWDRQF